MVIVDTSAWIHWFNRNDTSNSAKAIVKYLENCRNELVTTDLIIEETHKWLIHHSHNPPLACDILYRFNQREIADIIPIEDNDRTNAVAIVRKYMDQKVSYTDAITVVIVKRLKLKYVCSADSHFDLFPGIQRVPLFTKKTKK